MNRAWWKAASAVYSALLLAVSALPDKGWNVAGAEVSLRFVAPRVQNLLHVPAFAGLAFLYRLAGFSRAGAAAAAVLLAAATELLQAFSPGRVASLTDLGLDLFGIALALAVPIARPAPRPR